jgi:hypothetical protein
VLPWPIRTNELKNSLSGPAVLDFTALNPATTFLIGKKHSENPAQFCPKSQSHPTRGLKMIRPASPALR